MSQWDNYCKSLPSSTYPHRTGTCAHWIDPCGMPQYWSEDGVVAVGISKPSSRKCDTVQRPQDLDVTAKIRSQKRASYYVSNSKVQRSANRYLMHPSALMSTNGTCGLSCAILAFQGSTLVPGSFLRVPVYISPRGGSSVRYGQVCMPSIQVAPLRCLEPTFDEMRLCFANYGGGFAGMLESACSQIP